MKITLAHAMLLVCAASAFGWYLVSSSNHGTPEADFTAAPTPNSGNDSMTSQEYTCALNGNDCSKGVQITLIKFNGNKQCTSCINLGKFANATINNEYPALVSSGNIRYVNVNTQADPENEFVKKYRPTTSSIFLVVNDSGDETVKELTEAWYYTGSQADYETYLVGVLEPYLR